MALLVNAQSIAKSFGAAPLFQDLSLRVSEGDRIGLIGPNGSGKSTLLHILAGSIEPDRGEVAIRKATRICHVSQDSEFPPGVTVLSVIQKALDRAQVPEDERKAREGAALGRAGFQDFEAESASLSGGWRKRLAIAEALVQDPAILLLDEPTNHLDLAGIAWLEALLGNASFASIAVSHDRYFLENVATSVAELNPVYPGGLLWIAGNYSAFLEKKDEYLRAQAKRQEALENRVRREMEWLRRGPKARATKAKARIDRAESLIGELDDLKARSRTETLDIDFASSGRKTKQLVELRQVAIGFPGKTLLQHLDFTISAGMRVGLVGANGSGKTSLLRLLRGEIEPLEGEIQRAEWLRTVYFEQRRQLDPNRTLRRTLAPDGDSVLYQDRVIHVAGWASRFLFSSEQLDQPVGRLSGGERARVLIANLMLEPADLLLLDEPTNDLDIPALEVLEENLIEFQGAMVLVTHDRYLLDSVSTVVLGLDGRGGAERFASYSQWEAWQQERDLPPEIKERPVATPARTTQRKLSYLEAREMSTIEDRIAAAEQVLKAKRTLLEDPLVIRDGRRVEEVYRDVESAQQAVDQLYERWAELDAKFS